MITYRQIKKADQTTGRAVGALLVELSGNTKGRRSPTSLGRAVREKNCFILGAYEEGALIGMATLVCFVTLAGTSGRIEDVVVHEAARGKGVGRELMGLLIKEARRRKLGYLELTSSPGRIAANKLYQSLGFQLRETNVYRMVI